MNRIWEKIILEKETPSLSEGDEKAAIDELRKAVTFVEKPEPKTKNKPVEQTE